MKVGGACGGPTRQDLIPGLFLLMRWSRNRKLDIETLGRISGARSGEMDSKPNGWLTF
jgi:hypothetical protein